MESHDAIDGWSCCQSVIAADEVVDEDVGCCCAA